MTDTHNHIGPVHQRTNRLILAVLHDDSDAARLLDDEIGECAECWRVIACVAADRAAQMTREAAACVFKVDPANADTAGLQLASSLIERGILTALDAENPR